MSVFDKLRRTQDAIFCLSDAGVRPDIQEELKKDVSTYQSLWEKENEEKQRAKLDKKQYIPENIRWAVWERDNFTCVHCGSRKNLTVDHIIPESKGGQLTMENTQTLCKSCNSRKGAR